MRPPTPLPVALLLALFTLCLAAPPPAAAQVASLLRDVNQSFGGEPGSSPGHFRSLGSRVVFTAQAQPASNPQLWATDGSGRGTRLLADAEVNAFDPTGIYLHQTGDALFWRSIDSRLWVIDGTPRGTLALTPPGRVRVHPAQLSFAESGGLFFFTAEDEAGFELWRTDRTPEGTWRVKDVLPGHRWSQPADFVDLDGTLFFRARFDCRGRESWGLWRSDGTEAGTARVLCTDEDVWSLVRLGDRLIFVHGQALKSSDGTAAGTHLLKRFSFSPQGLTPLGGDLFFTVPDGNGDQLWASDGTPAGTVLVAQLDVGFEVVGAPMAVEHGVLFLTRNRFSFEGLQLWRTTAAPGSTTPVRDLCPDRCAGLEVLEPSPFDPLSRLAVAGGRLFFAGRDPRHGIELWASDGTGEGTGLVADLCPGPCGEVRAPTAIGEEVYFVAVDGDGGQELWATDGGATVPVTRFAGRGRALEPGALVDRAGEKRLVFAAENARYGAEPWTSLGTPDSTELVADLSRTAPGSEPHSLAEVGGRLVFAGCAGDRVELWGSAGTPESTAVLSGLDGSCGSFRDSHAWVSAGGLFYLVSWNRLLRSDATAAGTFPILEAPQGDLVFHLIAALGEAVYFMRRTPQGHTLWRTDGTPQGTSQALALDGLQHIGHSFASLGDALYFTAFSDEGEEVWTSDGTAAGTRRLARLEPTQSFPIPGPRFTRVGEEVFFRVEAAGGTQLWKTDGTAAGTAPFVESFGDHLTEVGWSVAFGDALYFLVQARADPSGRFYRLSLWRSDGTAEGTGVVREFDRQSSPTGSIELTPTLFPLGDRLYFAAFDEAGGREPWTSDGTAAETRRVRDLAPGAGGSDPDGFTAAPGGRVFFTASTASHGRELWLTDGTAAGTRLVHDVAPGAASSAPRHLTVAGSWLFFSADDGVTGREPWVLPLAGGTEPCGKAATSLCLRDGRFRVEAVWRTRSGRTGTGKAVQLTPDTGTFWFFDDANVETIVKVLDGRGINDHLWVFYGALSDVEYFLTVTDTATGLTRRYFNPLERLASVADAQAFGPGGASFAGHVPFTPEITETALPAPEVEHAAAGACAASATRLCLREGRFAVEIAWELPGDRTGSGQAVHLSDDTGYFWFFDDANVETVVKVLDGTGLNGRFWVFYGALSDVAYAVTVTDTATGVAKTYRNPRGRLASVADTQAF